MSMMAVRVSAGERAGVRRRSATRPIPEPDWHIAKSGKVVAEGLLARQTAYVLQRCSGHPCSPGGCRHEDEQLARTAVGAGPAVHAPPIVAAVLRSPGRPLDPALRADIERRFGHDFTSVRVHTDASAAESVSAVHATAYTVGTHIAFASGRYTPSTPAGRRLLAHELAHVVQQADATSTNGERSAAVRVGAADTPAEREAERAAALMAAPASGPPTSLTHATGPSELQRACPRPPTNVAATPSAAACTPAGPVGVAGSLLYFCQDSIQLVDGQAGLLADLVEDAKLASSIEVHGNASREGSASYNQNLACIRADTIAGEFRRAGMTAPVALFSHGETTVYGAPQFNRNVVVAMTLRSCGPEATDWFVRQVATAKADPAVLAVRRDLANARRMAGRWGMSAEQLAIGGVAEKVLAQEVAAGRPPRTAEATAQLTAAAPGQRELTRAEAAIAAGAIGPAGLGTVQALDLSRALLAIRTAAIGWRDLVGTGRRYDFKNDPGTMRGPSSAHCPAGCAGTITLCRASRSDCYQTDVPGNLFYAHVGRFVGWTELVLQLGSEFAQLASTRTWDPPEDTRMISFGFALPDPLSRAALCAALAGSRSIFVLHPCANCPEPAAAVIR